MSGGRRESTMSLVVVGPGPETEGGITEVIRRVLPHLENVPGARVHWVAMHRSGGVLTKLAAALAGLWRALVLVPGADVVHIHSSAYVSFLRKSLVYWIAAAWRRPVIWHLHTPNDDFVSFFGSRGLLGSYARAVISKARKVVVLSESWRAIVAPYIAEEKVAVIPNPIPDIDNIASGQPPDNEVRILYLAHLIQRKGYPLLIRAFARVAADHPDSRLVFAGSGEVDEAKALCDELGIGNRVEFLGWIQEAARTRELHRAEIFVLPSYQEGLPMGILESMAYGLAVITTPVGGIADVVKHRQNGLLVSPGDDTELSDALRALLEDETLRRHLGSSASEDVSVFGSERVASQWMRMYQAVMPDPAKAGCHDYEH